MPNARQADGQGFYAAYLRANGAGDEFRANAEVRRRFFGADGRPDPVMLKRLRHTIAALLYPSRARALTLDKAYCLIVREQSFGDGRDTTIAPPQNVCRQVPADQAIGVKTSLAALEGSFVPR